MWLVSGSSQRKLVLALVLAISLGPVVQGLECYLCSFEEGAPGYSAKCGSKDPETTETCSNKDIGCVFRTESDEKFVKRECVEKGYVSCLEEHFQMKLEDGQCVTKDDLTPEKWEAFNDCDAQAQNKNEGNEVQAAAAPASGDGGSEAGCMDAESDASASVKHAIQAGPGSRNDVSKVEICFCKSDKCNSNAIQPKSALSMEGGGVGNVKAGLALTVLVSVLGLALGWIQ